MAAGTWNGGGTIELTGDIKENLRCRASYNYGAANSSLALSIRCASDNLQVRADQQRGRAARPDLRHLERSGLQGLRPDLRARAGQPHRGRRGRRQLTSDLAVTTTANRMMVTMTPKATYVIAVKMAFNRGK